MSNDKTPIQWISVQAAAKELGIDPSSLYRLCTKRLIKHARIGVGRGRIVFTRSGLDEYLQSATVEVASAETEQEEPGLAPGTSPGMPFELKFVRPQGAPKPPHGKPGPKPKPKPKPKKK